MSYALIDNATLSAVQRVTGAVQSRSKDSLDGDLAALENVVEAILFYDDLVCLDDYKPEYSRERRARFPFIHFLPPSEFNLRPIVQEAKAKAKEFRPKIVGGEFADDDFLAFFNQLKMHVVCTWDVASSIHYLTLKMLGEAGGEEFEKYGRLSASIFNELADAKETRGLNPYRNNVLLFDSAGNPIDDKYRIPWAKWSGGKTRGMASSLAAFVASLNWVAYKTLYYVFAARYFHTDLFLYPIRQAFLVRFMQRTEAYDADFVTALIEKMTKQAVGEVEAIFSANRAQAVSLDIPFFSAWLVKQTGDVKRILPAALEVRSDREIVEARQQLREIEVLLERDEMVSASAKSQRLLRDIERSLASVRQKYGVQEAGGLSLARLIKVYNGFASLKQWPKLPELDLKIPLPQSLAQLPRRHGFASLYRSVANDLAQIPRLGKLRDALGSGVVLYEQGSASYHPKASIPPPWSDWDETTSSKM
jgi:hypothetical protein